MGLLDLLVVVLVFCVVVWAIRSLLIAFAMPPQVQAVVTVLVVLIFVLWIVSALGLLPMGPVLRFRP